MTFYPPGAPGGQFSGNTLRPTGPMPMQAQQGVQLNNPTPATAPAAGGQLAGGVGLGRTGDVFTNTQGQRIERYPPNMTPAQRVQEGFSDFYFPGAPPNFAAQIVGILQNPRAPAAIKDHLRTILGIR